MKEFTIHYGYDPDIKQYTASAPELHLSEFGYSFYEAEENLKDAISLYFDDLSPETKRPKLLITDDVSENVED